MVFSTGHDRLLVPERTESRGACRVGAGRREIPRHSWDVAVDVEYWSRTLTAGSQLCKECTNAALWRTTVRLVVLPCFDVTRVEHSADEVEKLLVLDSLLQHCHEEVMVNVVERPYALIPLSTTRQ